MFPSDSDADTVGDTDVKVGAYGGSVYAILFAYAVLPEYFVSQMLFFYLPLVRETGVIDELSDVSGNRCFSHATYLTIGSGGRGIKLLDSRNVGFGSSHRLLFKRTFDKPPVARRTKIFDSAGKPYPRSTCLGW